jgi:ABC-type polysaccharide/polyol phosphate export permease
MLAILVVFTGGLTPHTPFILVYLFFISVFAVGLGWILSSLNVYLRDIKQVIGLIMLGWFFFTPIFWSPSRLSPRLLSVMKFNPMFVVVDGYRSLLLAGRMPTLLSLAYLAGVALLSLAVGGIFFRKLKPGFAEVL